MRCPDAKKRAIRVSSLMPSWFVLGKGKKAKLIQADPKILDCEKELLMMGNALLGRLKRHALIRMNIQKIPVLDQIQWTIDCIRYGGCHIHNDLSELIQALNLSFTADEMIVVTWVWCSKQSPVVRVEWFSNEKGSGAPVGFVCTSFNTFHIQSAFVQSEAFHKVKRDVHANGGCFRIAASMRQVGLAQTGYRNIRSRMAQLVGVPLDGSNFFHFEENCNLSKIMHGAGDHVSFGVKDIWKQAAQGVLPENLSDEGNQAFVPEQQKGASWCCKGLTFHVTTRRTSSRHQLVLRPFLLATPLGKLRPMD